MGAFLTYALDEGNNLVYVDNVAKGAKCACHCPHCEAPLYAKNSGLVREHHFAHAKGHECESAFETSLHLLAKEILIETGKIMLPHSEYKSFPFGLVRLHNIQAEKWDDVYRFRPDVEGIMDNGERLIIEFFVSHKVDGKKRKTIVDNHLKCIEIDVNYQALEKEELRDFLVNSHEDRRWIESMPLPTKKTEDSFSYGRNPQYDIARDLLKNAFEKDSIYIMPTLTGELYNLKQYRYDVCEVNTKYKGFKSDLLLYRSLSNNKGYISINIRGRRRKEGFRYPKGLRIIDIILKHASDDEVHNQLKEGYLIGSFFIDILYMGFNEA
ncbi:MAG: hypothetical protein IKH44_15285 [Bacteroidales bacterium]|nr:hypothetical protein [Bacteroidales bacterium]